MNILEALIFVLWIGIIVVVYLFGYNNGVLSVVDRKEYKK